MSGKILVTPRSVTKNGHHSLEKLLVAGYEVMFCTPGSQPDENELKRLLPNCVGYLAGVENIPAAVLASASSVKIISRNGTGVDNIDLDAAKILGIKVCRADGANARGVAELTMALMLSLVRSIPFSDAAIKSGKWERRNGIELENRTLGLIGFGKIGKLVSGFASAFGMKIAIYDPCLPASFRPPDGVRVSSFNEILESSDIVSLHCPPAGKPVIGKTEIEMMKNGAYLINTARAELIDEDAVLAAINSGRLSGYATDVFTSEPPKDLTLARHHCVIGTPHIGGLTTESVGKAMNVAVENLIEALAN
ncbi:MAG: phosphoglycerate dehydrogenase [Victivallaceae bacterium]